MRGQLNEFKGERERLGEKQERVTELQSRLETNEQKMSIMRKQLSEFQRQKERFREEKQQVAKLKSQLTIIKQKMITMRKFGRNSKTIWRSYEPLNCKVSYKQKSKKLTTMRKGMNKCQKQGDQRVSERQSRLQTKEE